MSPLAALSASSLLDLLLRGALVLLAAGALDRLLGSGSERHRLWVGALALLLALPLLSGALPPIPVPLPDLGPPLAPAAAELFDRATTPAAAVPTSAGAAAAESDPSFSRPIASALPGGPALQPGAVLLALWAAGTLLLTGRMLRAQLALGRLRREALPLDGNQWTVELGRLRERLGLRRPVQLVIHPAARTPMTWGVRRPVIALPPEALDWSAARRRVVLLHELAHVRRFDAPWLLLARLACAFHWPDPLAWRALRRIAVERELACDRLVLDAGVRPSAYARQLFDLSRRTPSHRFSGALAMARRSSLEVRLMSILDPHSRTTPPAGRLRRALVPATLVVLAGVVAVLRPGEPASAVVRIPTALVEPLPLTAALPAAAQPQEPSSAGLAEAAAAAREAEREMRVHQERLEEVAREMEAAAEPIEELQASLEPHQAELERLHAELELRQEPLRRLQAELEAQRVDSMVELERRVELAHRELEAELEPLHRELEEAARALEPQRRALEEAARTMEPTQRELEEIHRRMEPVHRQMEAMHERLEPFEGRMKEIHREMEPVLRRLEETHRRLDAALTRELRGLLARHLDELALDDAALDALTARVRRVVNLRLDDDRLRLRASASELRELLAEETGAAPTHPAIDEAVDAVLELDTRVN